jgi:Fe-S cluster assembly ATPase SufC
MEKIKADDKFIPSANLVVLDEIDEGMDLKSQSKLVNIINRITDTLLADVVVITHSIMVPIFAGVKEVFDMDSRSVTTVEEYMKKATGKTIKIEVENA